MQRRSVLAAMTLAPLFGARAAEPPWPNKPVRIIAGGAGSVTDIRARWLAPRLSAALGQPVFVENKAGAGGGIAAEAGARSSADGSTLTIVHQGTLARELRRAGASIRLRRGWRR